MESVSQGGELRGESKRGVRPPKVQLTKAVVEGIQPPAEGRRYFYDRTTPGLALAVTATGKRTFYRCGKVDGRAVRILIGTYPAVTIEKARKEAARLSGQVAVGDDPQEQRRRRATEWTLGQLFDWYLDSYARPHKKTWREDEAQFKRCLTGWANRRLSTINKSDVLALHAKIGKDNGIYAANRLRSLLCKMFVVAADAGWQGDNPTRGVKKFREQSRARFLQADELPRLFQALADEPSERVRDFIIVSLLTGARRGNVLAMRWADLDLKRGLWTIPAEASKTAEAMTLPLVPRVLELLQQRREAGDRSEYVFPGRHGTGHLQDPTKPWKAILKRAGLEDVRLHDLRRTLASWAALGGASLQVIGKALGHRRAETTMIYSRLSIAPVQDVVTMATGAILAVAEPANRKPEAQGATDGEA